MCEEACQDLLKSCVLFKGIWSVVMKKKWGGNRRKRLYSEMWGNNV